MATQTFNLSLTMPDTKPAGNTPLSITLHLTPAEAKTLRQIRDGLIGQSLQPAVTGVDRTIRILLQQIATALP